jgi:porin
VLDPVSEVQVAAVEATYVAEVRPGWTAQPDVQYIVYPGGCIPSGPGDRPPRNATVVGLRSTVVY